MKRVLRPLRARPRLVLSCCVGVAASLLLPGPHDAVTRFLSGWNVAAWLYLGLVGLMMFRADHERLRRTAIAHAEGAGTVLALVVLATLASLVGIVVELAAAKVPGTPHAVPRVLFALATVSSAWLLLPTLFTLAYASQYYLTPAGAGLAFPVAAADAKAEFRPDYGDFAYFAFTIAVASQTSDVAVNNRPMRPLVLLQTLLSFAFNAAILAFTINIAASLF
jgi:uncharacterized membrane protein